MQIVQEETRLPEARAPILQAHLAGVVLTSPDPAALARFYEEAMGYQAEGSGPDWTGRLDSRWLTIRAGAGNRVDQTAFAVADLQQLAELRDRLRAASVPFAAAALPFFSGEAIRVSDPDGNVLLFGIETAKPAPAAATPARLQHIVFASDATAPMMRFYCDVLGFAPSDYVKDADGDLTSAFLRCGTEHHTLAIFRAPAKRLDHLCYDVGDWMHIRDWADRFAARHITLRWGPGRHGPGNNLFLFVNDPDGNWLEFSAELDQVEGGPPIKLWVHEQRTLNSWGTAFLRS